MKNGKKQICYEFWSDGSHINMRFMNGPKPKFPPKEKPLICQPHSKITKTFRAKGSNVMRFFGAGRIASKREN